jgi:TonB-dependent Receptor Plug Domain.
MKCITKLRLLFVSFLLVLPFIHLEAQKHSISGYVIDASSQETLIGATIFDRHSGKGCVANSYGFYSITLEEGSVEFQVSYVGYESSKLSFVLDNDTVVSFKLKGNVMLEEVVVEAGGSTVSARSPQMSVVELPVQQIKSIPTLFGEADVLKAIQLLPGVQNGSEGSAGMYVRGGGPDENLLLLDGVPVYNVNHMMGFFQFSILML